MGVLHNFSLLPQKLGRHAVATPSVLEEPRLCNDRLSTTGRDRRARSPGNNVSHSPARLRPKERRSVCLEGHSKGAALILGRHGPSDCMSETRSEHAGPRCSQETAMVSRW